LGAVVPSNKGKGGEKVVRDVWEWKGKMVTIIVSQNKFCPEMGTNTEESQPARGKNSCPEIGTNPEKKNTRGKKNFCPKMGTNTEENKRARQKNRK
jgi:NADH pyrophosphatase NudC (nudix superfamily)